MMNQFVVVHINDSCVRVYLHREGSNWPINVKQISREWRNARYLREGRLSWIS